MVNYISWNINNDISDMAGWTLILHAVASSAYFLIKIQVYIAFIIIGIAGLKIIVHF